MSKRRLPSAVRNLRGSTKNHPERENKREPKPKKAVGIYPRYLPKEGKELWDDLIDSMPDGVYFRSDRPVMIQACSLWAQFKQSIRARKLAIEIGALEGALGDKADDDPKVLKLRAQLAPISDVRWGTRDQSSLIRCLGELGASPAARQKVEVPKEPDDEGKPKFEMVG